MTVAPAHVARCVVALLVLTLGPLTACGAGQDPFGAGRPGPAGGIPSLSAPESRTPGGATSAANAPGATPASATSSVHTGMPTRPVGPASPPGGSRSAAPRSTNTHPSPAHSIPVRSTPAQATRPPTRPAPPSRTTASPPPSRPGRGRPKVLYLTFDDGPSAQYTPQVLALLQRYHAHAVFCEIGLRVNEHPEITRQVVAAGHTLCDHTLTHDEHLPRRSQACLRHEIDGGLGALRTAVPGVHVPYFRAPGGNWSAQVHAVARQDGMASLTWTIDPRDWSRPGVDRIVATVTADAHNRSVLLLHDGGGPRDQTVAALTVLLPRLVAQGYTFPVAPPAMFTLRRPRDSRPPAAPTSPRCTTAACCAAD